MQEIIINHYPPVIKNIKEIRQIAGAEDIEFEKLKLLTNRVLQNMFISTADESGTARFEKMLGIVPQKSQSLEERKLFIEAKMRQGKISLGQLQDILQKYSQGIRLISYMDNNELEVVTGEDAFSREAIYKMIDEILPLNICFEVSRELRAGLYVNLGLAVENYVNIEWEG